MSRMTVFHHADNEAGHVMAVISEADCHVFYGLGFFESADKVEPIAPSGDTAALTGQIAQLEQRIEELQAQIAASPAKNDAPTMDTGGAPEVKEQKKNSKA